jgi:hypothetical protein
MGKHKWTKDELETAVRKHDNFSDVLRDLNLKLSGGNWKSIRKYCEQYFIDISHFDYRRKCRDAVAKFKIENRYTIEEIFCENSTVSKSSVRTQYRKISDYKCVICDNRGSHLCKPLILQLDHINGESSDNRLENLRWLCPNCHSQTDTFAGRNNSLIFCRTCNRPTSKKSGYCTQDCRPKPITKEITMPQCANRIEWPNWELVKARVEDVGFEKCGKELGVSGNAVKKFLKRNNIVLPKYYTQSKY